MNDKVALVLGAVKGIGKGIGIALAQKGFKLALTRYDWQESFETMEKDFKKFDPLILDINLLETDKIQSMIDNIISHYGRLDILINNIERGGWPIVHGHYTQTQWDLEMATTLRSKKWIFEAALPYLKASGDGVVINFSSIAGIVGRSGPASLLFNEGYSSANRGISLLTETWARMGAPQVRVNEIMLGIFETRHGDQTRGWGLLSNGQKKAIIDHILVNRTGKIDDITKAVLFIIQDAPYMTGSILRLDGGYILGGEQVGIMPKGIV